MVIIKAERRGGNVRVSFSEGEPVLLCYETYMKQALRKGDQISESGLAMIIKEDSFLRAKNKAFALLGTRAHSGYEISRKLRAKKFSPEVVKRTLDYLTENSYIDDRQFAREFIEERLRLKKSGINKIKQDLYGRGVPKALIEQETGSLLGDEVQFENLMVLAEKKLSFQRARGLEEEKIKMSLYRFLISKGYESNLIRKAFSLLNLE